MYPDLLSSLGVIYWGAFDEEPSDNFFTLHDQNYQNIYVKITVSHSSSSRRRCHSQAACRAHANLSYVRARAHERLAQLTIHNLTFQYDFPAS